jgi:hypothetical protein
MLERVGLSGTEQGVVALLSSLATLDTVGAEQA